MKTMTIIGKNLKDFRVETGYTQDDIATFLKVDRSTISNYESAKREINIIHLSKLADLFGVEMEVLSEPGALSKSANFAFAFRRDGLNEEDLESISSFQKIVKNYIRMSEIEGE